MSKTLSAISLHHNLRAYAPFTAGGKGTVRRKIVRKAKPSTAQDDKKLQGALKKLNVQPIPGVEEVNMFREDGNVLHFTAPKGELYSLFGTATPLSTTFFSRSLLVSFSRINFDFSAYSILPLVLRVCLCLREPLAYSFSSPLTPPNFHSARGCRR